MTGATGTAEESESAAASASERRWSFAGRLERVLLGLLVLMVTVGALGGLGVVLTTAASQRAADIDAVLAAQARAFQSLTDAETGLRGYQLTGDAAFLVPYHEGLKRFPVSMDLAVRRARPLGDVAPLLAELRRSADAWRQGYAEPAVSRVPSQSALPSNRFASEDAVGKRAFDRVRAAQVALEDRLTQLRDGALQTSRRVRTAVLLCLALALAAAVVAALVAARRLTRETVRPLQQLRTSLGQLRSGRWGERVKVSEHPGAPREIVDVGTAVNALAVELERMREADAQVSRLRAATREVARVARQHLEQDALVAAATAAVGEALRVDRVWLRQLRTDDDRRGEQDDGGARRQWLGDVVGEWARAGLSPVGDTPTARDLPPDVLESMWRGSRVIAIDDVTALPPDEQLEASYVARTGIRSLLVVPLGAGTRPLGALTLQRVHVPQPWSDEEIRAVQSIAADLGYALLHAGLYRSQQQLVEQLRDLDRQKSEFLSMVSHELRTPLTSITGYLELLGDDPAAVSERGRRMLDVIERNAGRLSLLIEDLLVLSRIEAGRLRVQRDRVRAEKVVDAAVEAVAAVAARSGVRLVVEPPAMPDAEVIGDVAHLERVLLNLVGNGVKFTPAGGEVRVRTQVAAGRLEWLVSDTGIGIPAQDVPRLFTRFFRAANAQAAAIPGTGLGLAIVRSILEQHGGGIAVDSREGRGTTFRTWLPLAAADAGTESEAAFQR
ncbi:MAG: ATP-binding protein [Actinomycetales bacterium]